MGAASKAPNVEPVRLMYTSIGMATQERRVIPRGFRWMRHASLAKPEWFIEAWDIDAASECVLRIAGCDFLYGEEMTSAG